MLLQLADKLQDNSIIVALTSTGWTAAGLAILHYYSMFVLVGSMAIVDLRVLGIVGGGHSLSDFSRRIFPWVWLSLGLNLISGFIMFAGDATAYVPTHSFQFKLLVVLVAIVLAMIVQWRIPAWDQSPVLPPRQDLGAAFALVLDWGHPDGRRSAGDLGNRLSG